MKALVVIVAAVVAVAAFAVPAGAEDDDDDVAFCDTASWIAATGGGCDLHYSDSCNAECKKQHWRVWHHHRSDDRPEAPALYNGATYGFTPDTGTRHWQGRGTYKCVDFQTAHPTFGYYMTVRNVIVHRDGSYQYC